MSIDYRPDNTIIFTIARMNPPTPGHLFIIQRLIEEGINKNAERVYVILSKTNDNNENPIPCPEKINVLVGKPDDISKTMIKSIKEKMKLNTEDEEIRRKIDNMIVESICVPEQKGATPFTTLFDIITQKSDVPDLNFFFVIGDDRANMLDSITDTLFNKCANINSVDGTILDRPNMSQFKELSSNPESLSGVQISEFPESAISASFVRNLVKYDMRDKFFELYSPYLDEEKIEELFQRIKSGLELPPNKSRSRPPKPLKYNYPMFKRVESESIVKSTPLGSILGKRKSDEDKNVGGKKTKKKKSKKTKTKKRKTKKTRKHNKK